MQSAESHFLKLLSVSIIVAVRLALPLIPFLVFEFCLLILLFLVTLL